MDSSQRLEAAEAMIRTLVDETQQLERRVSRRAATTRRMLARTIPPAAYADAGSDPSTTPTRRDIRPVCVREETSTPRDDAEASGRYSIVHPRRRLHDRV